ncbi:microsomal triglyceride transfer protein large subunit [Plakobranchus ocellatus]|uniref:Microsomal triglyceride transfer protein large subunit n=1 Tax=Plakobranchus ocellatus TaxID=259542 RepID=A0AAV4BJL3_9GAST|nr:microsomal triglyceride transfer protein large subunit [Plakobranchus ocellatus]
MGRVIILFITISSLLQCVTLKSVVAQTALSYDPTKAYLYSYQSEVLLNDASSKRETRPQKDVGFKIGLEFELTTAYRDKDVHMFKIKIVEGHVTSVARPDLQKSLLGAEARSTLSLPAYFQLRSDQVDSLHFAQADSVFGRNLKKAIAGMFQLQGTQGTRTEVDVSGECEVTYTIPQPGFVERTLGDCSNLEIAGEFSNTNKALGVSLYSRSSQLYHLKDSVIERMTGNQRVYAYLNLRSALNGAADVSQNLQLKSTSDGPDTAPGVKDVLEQAHKEAGSPYQLSLLPSEEEVTTCRESECESPSTLAARYSDALKADEIATVKSAKAFAALLKSFRSAGKKTITEILTSSKSYYIVPQLMDIATATQTEASRQALMELLNFEDADATDHPQRFLFAAAYSSHPSESLIADLMSVLKKPIPNEDLRQSLLLALGSIVHTFCQVSEQCANPIVTEFTTTLTSSLAACKEESCTLMYLRALGNAGLPSYVSIILPFAESPGKPMVAATAIQAFRRIESNFLGKEVKEVLQRIFHQNKASYDSSVRVAALELLLDIGASDITLKNVLLSCLDQSSAEFSTYVLKLVLDKATAVSEFGVQVASVLHNLNGNNYNILSQRGKSSVITSYLARMRDLNATYNLYFENSQSGVMKRSGMIVDLQGNNMKQPLMKFGIYADGLESLVGSEEEAAEDEDESDEEDDMAAAAAEPTAGMTFTFLDVLLTHVEFFRGTSGLMSAAWNAPSELTSALQGNLLLQDHSKRVHLSNGLVLDTSALGVLSMDLSGSISISLWNRNCESLIRTSGALYVEGSLRINSKELGLGLTFTGEGQSNIDYTGNADFYNMPLKLCMEMKRPEFVFTKTLQKFEKLRKRKSYKTKQVTKSKISGESYLLNQRNSDECRVMLAED